MQQDDRQQTNQQNSWRERRIEVRQETAVEASVNFLVRALELRGHLENLSLSGARFAATAACPRGAGHLVELSFRLEGHSFRLASVVQWNDGNRLGLQYEPLSERRRQELQHALVLESVRQSIEQEGPEGSWTETLHPEAATAPVLDPLAALAGAEGWQERRAHRRVGVELPAAIYLINSNVKLNGSVENLCLGGCRIHTDQRVQVGIYTRIEVLFFHQGMPFRVAGVIQVLHKPNEVGIRFLDVTERIGAKLTDLMQELEGGVSG